MNLNILFKVVFWRGLTAIFSFLTVIFCMRMLSVDQFADYSLAFTIYTAFCLIPNIGINNFYVYENAASGLDLKQYNIKIYFIALLFIFYVISLFDLVKDIYIYAAMSGILGSIFDYKLVEYQAKKNFKKYALFMPARTLIFFIIVISVFFFKNNKEIVKNIFETTLLVFLIYYLWSIKDKFNSSLIMVKDNLSIYTGAYSFLVYEICVLLMVRAEVWILSIYTNWGLSKVDVANYWAAFNFILIVSILGNTLANIILPYIKSEIQKDILILNNMIKKVALMMLGILLVTIFFVDYISDILFNKNYENLTSYVAVLGVGVFFGFLSNIERLRLIKNKNNMIDKMVIVQLIFCLILNFILIFFLHIWGAILAYVLVRLFSYISFKYFSKIRFSNH